jgi:hypothetical protein
VNSHSILVTYTLNSVLIILRSWWREKDSNSI